MGGEDKTVKLHAVQVKLLRTWVDGGGGEKLALRCLYFAGSSSEANSEGWGPF